MSDTQKLTDMEHCPLCGESLGTTTLPQHLLVCTFDDWEHDHPDHQLINS